MAKIIPIARIPKNKSIIPDVFGSNINFLAIANNNTSINVPGTCKQSITTSSTPITNNSPSAKKLFSSLYSTGVANSTMYD